MALSGIISYFLWQLWPRYGAGNVPRGSALRGAALTGPKLAALALG